MRSMKQQRWPLALAGLALGLLVDAGPAAAQGTVRSQVETTTKAIENQSQLGIEEIRAPNGVSYVSGGVGIDAVRALNEVKGRYNLHLLFAVQGSGEYLANVHVRLADAHGNTVIDAVSEGPYFFASIPAGRYQLSVDSEGRTMTRTINVAQNRSVSESFYWNSVS